MRAMSTLTLAFAFLRYRPMSTLISVAVFALGIAILLLLLLIGAQADQLIQRNFKNIDLVVGAKGSPVQLILSSVLHVDAPTGNIPRAEADSIAHHPQVKLAVPLALGDSYRGFRIVGTEPSFIGLYEGRLAQGKPWSAPMEAVIGSQAQATLALGDRFAGSHGLGEGGEVHEAFPYTVTGILAPTGTVLDRLILTSLDSVWAIHSHHHHHDGEVTGYEEAHRGHDEHDEHEHGEHESGYDPSQEITGLLLQYTSPIAAVSMPRVVNATTSMQAANPAFELARMARMLGIGGSVVHAFGLLLVALAGLMIFAQLLNMVKDRQKNLVLLRVMGTSPFLPFRVMLLESVLIALAGVALGFLGAHAALWGMVCWLADSYHLPVTLAGWQPQEAGIIILALAIAIVAAFIPAWQAYRVDMLKALRAG